VITPNRVSGTHTFVHALDTSKRQARCIDLPMLTGRQDLWQLRFISPTDTPNLTVGTPAETLALIDTTNFRVSTPAQPTATKPETRHSERPWLLLAGATLLTILAASTLSIALRRRRTRPAPI
jgi:hypothetical protein